MLKLTEPAQLAIVHALARGETPAAVRALVLREFGLEPTMQQVAGYDPTRSAGNSLSRKLKALFYVARWAHANDTAETPDEALASRLRELVAQLERAPARGGIGVVADLFHQAAKVCGVLAASPLQEDEAPAWARPRAVEMCDRSDTKSRN